MTGPSDAGGFGDYLVFVDESGDHGITRVAPEYPVFVLLFVIVRKDDYVDRVCRDVQRLKLAFWGHDEVVLHENEIRKPAGPFRILIDRDTRERFMEWMNALIGALPVTLVAVVIDKPAFARAYARPVGLYDYALEAGLERVFRHLAALGEGGKRTAIVVERRGKREDDELELAFRRICDGTNATGKAFQFDLVMVSKAANSTGLQLADLMARPIGMRSLRPEQSNRAYDAIEPKFRRSSGGKVEGWGIKRLP